MKFICCFLFLFITNSILSAQNTAMISRQLMVKIEKHPESVREIGVFIKGDEGLVAEYIIGIGGFVKYAAGNITAASLSLNKVKELASKSFVERIEDSDLDLQPMNDRMVINNNIVPVHLGFSPLPKPYSGKGVMMGIIDTGIDFSHPDFKDVNGKSRIKSIWDHTLPGMGNSPQPYGYGREFTAAQIDSGNASDHFDKFFGHGTHVAGIAAGNGLTMNNYKGVAPDAEIVLVALEFNKATNDWLSSIVDATDYIYRKAQAAGMPCVINASVGTYIGSHDGKDLQALLINNLIKQQNGRSFVCAAGNAGNVAFHTRHNVSADTAFTWFRYNTSGQLLEIWSDTSEMNNVQFAIGTDKTAPNFEFRGMTGFNSVHPSIGSFQYDTIYSGTNILGTVSRYSELQGDRYVMYFDIRSDSTSYFFRLMASGSGSFDIWNFDVVSSNLPSVTDFPDITKYVLPDNKQSIVSSFSCSPAVITVGDYVNRNSYTDYNGTIQNLALTTGAITAGSSRGPTRDGRIKPDVCATGNTILSTMVLADAPWFIANQPFKLAAGGKHIRGGGTSAASPVVAGIAALYLEKNPNASWQDIKNAVISCTKTDQFTGNNLPDNTWGYGKIDGYQSLTGCIPSGMGAFGASTAGYIINYPNPFHSSTAFHYTLPHIVQHKQAMIRIRDIAGRTVKLLLLDDQNGSVELNAEGFAKGLFIYTLEHNNVIYASGKLAIN